MRIILTILFCFSSFFCWSQNDINYYKNKYPNANEVIISQTNKMDVRLDKGTIYITSKNNYESIITTNDINKIDTKESIPFSSFKKIKEIEAITEYQNKKYEVKNFRIVPDKSSRNFHDDVKIKEFDYSQLGFGAKKKLNYTTEYTDPKMLSAEIFIENYPTEYKEYQLTVDKDIEIGYKIFNDDNHSKITFSEEKKGNKIIYRWVAKNIPQYKFEEGMPSILYFVPLVEVYIKSYKNASGQKITLLNSLEDLHKLYQDYIKDIYETPSQDLVKKAEELKALHKEEIDQVKEIYYWVKDNIKYIAFEDGYGGFVPRKPNDVFTKRYGDCKDMAVIIYTMLRSVQINNTFLTWIGSREKPFTYNEMHTQMVDDHMIVTYQNNGKNYFLDGTSKETPFEYPTSFIQGKQALLHKSKDAYELVMVPVVTAEKNKVSANITLEIVKDKLIGSSTVKYSGYMRENFLNSMKDLNGFDKTNFLKRELVLGNNKFYLEKYNIKNQEDKDSALTVDYNFNIENYITTNDNEIYVNLFLNKFEELKPLDLKRETEYHIENKSNFTQTIRLKIPAGYQVDYLPKNDTLEEEFGKFTVMYQVKEGAVELSIDVKINFIVLQKDKIENWNNFIKRLRANTTESISLKNTLK